MWHHHIGIPHHPLCEHALKRLGFYQIAQMVGMNVNRFLTGAPVERGWPETHLLPTGRRDDSYLMWIVYGVYQCKVGLLQEDLRSHGSYNLPWHIRGWGANTVQAVPREFEWPRGLQLGAMLVMLFRQLCLGAERETLEIAGPWWFYNSGAGHGWAQDGRWIREAIPQIGVILNTWVVLHLGHNGAVGNCILSHTTHV